MSREIRTGLPMRRLPMLVVAAGAVAGSLHAEPLRLEDPTPRWVAVRFEESPSDRPGLLDRHYGPLYQARLEPTPDGRIRIRIAGDVLERSFFRDRNPVPGSFSDYVWDFDARSGDVLSATFSGRVMHPLSWGLGTLELDVRVEANMTTVRPSGFRPARRVWGSRLHGFCDDRSRSDCTLVSPRALDGSSGYVNAPGFLRIDSRFVDFSTFSALGEARFSELEAPLPLAERQPEADAERASAEVSRELEAAPGLSLGDVAAPPPVD